jgi:hypothetical protein
LLGRAGNSSDFSDSFLLVRNSYSYRPLIPFEAEVIRILSFNGKSVQNAKADQGVDLPGRK